MAKSRKFAAFAAIVFLIVLHPVFSLAQDDEEEENNHLFYAGLLAGVNFAQVDGDNFAGYYKVGLNVGGIGYWRFSKAAGFSWEILYSQKGSSNGPVQRYSDSGNTFIVKYGISVNYAEIPVMINVFDKHQSHLGIGLSYSQLVSSSETLQVTGLTGNAPPVSIDLSKYAFKKNNVDFLAGAQMHIRKGLFLNLRFQYSVIPIRTDIPPNYSRAFQYSNMWTLRLMYLFM